MPKFVRLLSENIVMKYVVICQKIIVTIGQWVSRGWVGSGGIPRQTLHKPIFSPLLAGYGSKPVLPCIEFEFLTEFFLHQK